MGHFGDSALLGWRIAPPAKQWPQCVHGSPTGKGLPHAFSDQWQPQFPLIPSALVPSFWGSASPQHSVVPASSAVSFGCNPAAPLMKASL